MRKIFSFFFFFSFKISSFKDDLNKAQEAWDEEQSKGEDKEREIEEKQKQLKQIQENRTENFASRGCQKNDNTTVHYK